MGWFSSLIEKFRRQSLRVISITIFAKFLFGVGLGALIADYFQTQTVVAWSWGLIITSLLLSIPAIYTVLIKK
jgi:F0F1-type ATP synthase assembly protein I